MEENLIQALRDFVATSNSGKYKTEEELLSKFPELQGYDTSVLRDFVATSNSGKYDTEEALLSKFPEFNSSVKKKEASSEVLEDGSEDVSPLESQSELPSGSVQKNTVPMDMRVDSEQAIQDGGQIPPDGPSLENPVNQSFQNVIDTAPPEDVQAMENQPMVPGGAMIPDASVASDQTNVPSPVIKDVEEDKEEIAESPEKYLPAGGALIDMEAAARNVVNRGVDNENYEPELAREIRKSLYAQGWDDESIVNVEKDLAKNHGINLDITGDGMLRSDIGAGEGAWNAFSSANAETVISGVSNLALGTASLAASVFSSELSQMIDDVNNGVQESVRGRAAEWKADVSRSRRGFLEDIEQGNVSAMGTTILNTLVESLPMMAAAAASGGGAASYATMSLLSASNFEESYKGDPEYEAMEDWEKIAFLGVMGAAEGIGEYVGGRVLSRAISNAAKKEGKKTAIQFLSGLAKAYGISSSEEFLAEGATSFIQSLAETTKNGEDIDIFKLGKETLEGAVLGAATGAGTVASVNTIARAAKTANGTYQALKPYIKDAKREVNLRKLGRAIESEANKPGSSVNTPMLVAKFQEGSKNLVIQEKANRESLELLSEDERSLALRSAQMAGNAKAAAEQATAPEAKEAYEAEAKRQEKVAIDILGRAKERAEKNEKPKQEDSGTLNTKETTANQEVNTNEGASEGEVNQENKQSVESDIAPEEYVKTLKETKDSDPGAFWSVDEVTVEDAESGTIIEADGEGYGLVTESGDIKGIFKSLGSKAKGVADKILQKAIKAGGRKLDNFDNYLTKIYERNGFRVVSRVPFSEDFAPEGWDKDRDGTPDAVSMIYDPNNELDIEEKTFENPDEANAYRDTYLKENETKNETKPKAGNRLFNKPIEAVKEIANKYVERVFGSKRSEFKGVKKLDKERAKRISDAYEKMEDNPTDPEVKEAYDKLVEETIEQYKAFISEGYVVEINNDEPYSSSQEMIDDLRDNKRMKIFSTESGFGDEGITEEQRNSNPLLAPTEYKDSNGQPLLVNDLFRAVHDFFGHAELGNSFGPLGEENAWNVHARMFSPLARRAMTSETRGQNSYVNFSGVNDKAFALRDEARRLRKEGKNEEAAKLVDQVYELMRFADQKIGLLPEEFSNIDEEVSETQNEFQDTETDIDEQVEDLEGLYSGEEVDKSERNERSKDPEKYKNTTLKNAIDKAAKALSPLGVKIVMEPDGPKFRSGNYATRGYYDPNTNTIVLNSDLTLEETVIHEALHAVLFSHFMSKTDNKFKASERVQELSSKLAEDIQNDPTISEELKSLVNEFVVGYSRNSRPEEFIVELASKLAMESTKTQPKSAIARFVNEILKFLGIKKKLNPSAASMLMNNLATSIREGVAMQNNDIDGYIRSTFGEDSDLFRPIQEESDVVNNEDIDVKSQLSDGTKFKITGKEKLKEGSEVINTRSKINKYTKEDARKGKGVQGEVKSITESRPNGTLEEHVSDQRSSEGLSAVDSSVGTAIMLASGVIEWTERDAKTKKVTASEKFNMGFSSKADATYIKKKAAEIQKIKKGQSEAVVNRRTKLKAQLEERVLKVLNDFSEYTKETLLGLYDSLDPEFVEESKNWYEGANRFANDLAKRYKISTEQAAGMLGVLSPQKDWFTNVSNAERVAEILTEHINDKFTASMMQKAYDRMTRNDSAGKLSSSAKDLQDLFNTTGEVSIQEILDNETYTDSERNVAIAMLVRGFDHALNSPSVLATKPNGEMFGVSTPNNAWNSYSEIGRAVSIFFDGSKENISLSLGSGNKVRNFYMNILAPNHPDGYATMDTHALAAATMLPASAKTAGMGFKLFSGGSSFYYAVVKDAYTKAAAERGIQPRQMQSVTWEAVRTGLNNASRTEAAKQEVLKLSEELSKNENITPYERAITIAAANPSATPGWADYAGISVQRPILSILQAPEPQAKLGERSQISLRKRAVDDSKSRTAAGLDTGSASNILEAKAQLADTNFNTAKVIADARERGFTDDAIRTFLRKRGYTVKEINEQMNSEGSGMINLLDSAPTAFGNIEGGMSEGVELYNRVMKKVSAYASKKTLEGTKKDPKTGKRSSRLRTKSEIRLFALTTLSEELENIKADDITKLDIINQFDRKLDNKTNPKVSQKLREIRKEIRLRKRQNKSLDRAKTLLRVFIRSNMPLGNYSKNQVMKLIQIVNDAKPANIQAAYEEVTEQIIRQNVKVVMNRIAKISKVKLVTNQNGTRKGKVTPETQEFISLLWSMLPDSKASVETLQTRLDEMEARYNALSNMSELTADQENELAAIIIAKEYVSAMTMEDTDSAKLDGLVTFYGMVNDIITTGRNQTKLAALERKKHYNAIKSAAFKDITNIDINFDSDKSVDAASTAVDKKQNLKDNVGRARRVVRSFVGSLDQLITRTEAMEGLADRMSNGLGEMFGGKLQELITDRLQRADMSFKGGKIMLMNELESGAKAIFGKKFRSIIDDHSRLTTFYYSNPSEGAVLEGQLKRAKSRSEKARIKNKLNEIKIQSSQNDLYYLYNQYKDPSTHPGFETKFGGNYRQVMAHITSQMDTKVRMWADWQVDVFYPSVFDRYNDVYRELNGTDMPQSMVYAGKLSREGDESDSDVDMFDRKTPYNLNASATSTKARKANKRAVRTMDGNAVLKNYIDEMEFFRSHAVPLRDIHKIMLDPLVRKGIEATSGKDVYQVATTMLERISNRGRDKSKMNDGMDRITNMFVKSKLGANPVVFIKQMTSALAFADYIGYRNWISYGAMSVGGGVAKFNNDWKELYANSSLLQDRYEGIDITRALENFTGERKQRGLTSQTNQQKFNDLIMSLIKYGDMGGVMGSIPNYAYYKAQIAKNNPSLSEKEIIKRAVFKVEKQIKTTQQSAAGVDKDIFQTGGSFERAFSVFMSSPKALFRKEVIATRAIYRKLVGKNSKGTLRDNMRTLFTYHILIPMFFQYVALGAPGLFRDWEDEDAEELGLAAIFGNLNAIFILGDIATMVKDIVTDKPWAGSVKNVPVLQVISSLGINLSRATNAKTAETRDKYLWKFIQDLSESSTGLPVGNLKKLGNNYYKLLNGDVENGEEAILRILGYSDYVITGGEKLSADMKKLKKQDPELFKQVMELKKAKEEMEKIQKEAQEQYK